MKTDFVMRTRLIVRRRTAGIRPSEEVLEVRNRRRTRCGSVPGLHTPKIVEINFNLGAKDFWSRFTVASDHATKSESSANYFPGTAVHGDTTLPSADQWVSILLVFTILLLIPLHDFPLNLGLISVVGFETHACQIKTNDHPLQINRVLFRRS